MIWEKDLVDLGGSNAVIIPSEVITYWRMAGMSTDRVKLTFKDGKLIIEPICESIKIQKITKPSLKLHEAICLVLFHNPGLTASQIADEIRKNNLYWLWTRGKIGRPPKSSQIRARIRKYPKLFRKENGRYYLTDKGLELAKDVIRRSKSD